MSDYFAVNDNVIATSFHHPSESAETELFIVQLRQGIWLFGISAWLFSLIDRGIAALADGYFSSTECLTVLAIFLLLLSWLLLKPQRKPVSSGPQSTSGVPSIHPAARHLEVVKARMDALQPHHLISQSYLLPYPYLAQIYHLLNLKHLETIHSFSLNNLRIVKVSSLEKTEQGGTIQFQTILNSPLNVLRIWRQPIVDVKLTLHTPHMVELGIPVYGNKVIIVLFKAIPISDTEHQFCVDIYSNLQWYKPLMKLLLHLASILTVIEDIPYLEALTRKVQRLAQVNNGSLDKTINHEMMWLFNRFMGLYGSTQPALKPQNLAS